MLPVEFKERMVKLLGNESERFFAELESGHAVRSFRVNQIKISPEDFEATSPDIDRAPAKFPNGAYYTEESFPGSLPCHHAGMIYMQDPSAMATVYAAKVSAGAKVLDSCSAPGGKTTQLAAFAGDEGIVVANEYESKRCRILQSNVERMGSRNTVVVNLDTAVLAETYPSVFDVVLCDAPCSGEGMFRKNAQAIDEWSPQNVIMCAERQREILTNVAKCVKGGGVLIYSTCTFSLEENEMNLAWFLDTFKDFSLEEVAPELKAVTADGIMLEGCEYDMTKARRFYPHVSAGEGQFIAVLRRNSADESEISAPKKDKKKKGGAEKVPKEEAELLLEAKKFIEDNLSSQVSKLIGERYELIALGGRAFLKPCISLPKFGVFAAGVCVGEMVGRKFAPHHQLFSAFGCEFLRRVRLSQRDRETADYLLGMEFPVGEREQNEGKAEGFAAVLVDNCPLGGVKISGGVCKNHYPKGLRNQR